MSNFFSHNSYFDRKIIAMEGGCLPQEGKMFTLKGIV